METIFLITVFMTVLCLFGQDFIEKFLFSTPSKLKSSMFGSAIWILASFVLFPAWDTHGCPGKAEAFSELGEKIYFGHLPCIQMSYLEYVATLVAGFVFGGFLYFVLKRTDLVLKKES